MRTNAPFGRTGVLHRLQLWWYAKDRSTRLNTVGLLALGAAVVALVGAATARDSSPAPGLVNALRPQFTVTSTFGLTTTTVDLRAAAAPGEPIPVSDQAPSTSTTVTGTVATFPSTPAPVGPTATFPSTPAPVGPTATSAPSPGVAVADPEVVYPQATPPPTATPSTLADTTADTPTVPVVTTVAGPTTVPPSTAPPSTTTPTTAATLLPPLLDLPLLPR